MVDEKDFIETNCLETEEDRIKAVERIMSTVKSHYPKADIQKIMHAYEVAESMHRGQTRKSGEPFIVHPISVASMLANMEASVDIITAGMLHDVVEDTSMTIDDVQAEFGSRVSFLVDGVTKLIQMSDLTKEEQQAENMRKMFLAIADDPRVVTIKLVDRLHNMRTLQYMNTDKQRKKAQETLDIYAPLAHRFGMSRIKWELEDLCFKYLDPVGYDELKSQLVAKHDEREAFIQKIIDLVRERIESEGIKHAFIDGRHKHLYSIKRKMEKQNKPLNQIYDLLAIRVVVDTISQCYSVLGIVHNMFTPVQGRFKDYIAMPKPNGYQSVHTTVIDHSGMPFEIQIRTWDMHNAAELGIAAHWNYKEGGKFDEEESSRFEWVRNLQEQQKEMDTPEEFIEAFKLNMYTDEIFVYTPKGDVKSLPAGSCPIDFAYAIHTVVGNKMVGARVNGELKPLDYALQTGDRVEIVTSKSPDRAPSRDWLKIVKSSEAKTKIRQFFKKERREENIEIGRDMLDHELKREGYTYQQLFDDEEILDDYLKKSNFHSLEDLMNGIGFGDISARRVITRLKDLYIKKFGDKTEDNPFAKSIIAEPEEKESVSEDGIIVQGLGNCLVRPAKCCNPVPGDVIVGYTTRARGVSVHRADCPNVASMMKNEQNRMIPVRWAQKASKSAAHPAQISIEAIDNGKTLILIANIINEMDIKMTSISSKSTKDNIQIIELVVQITDRALLDKLIAKIENLDSVSKVSRSVK